MTRIIFLIMIEQSLLCCVIFIYSHLDLLNLMTYDLHGTWESKLGHQAAMYSSQNEPVDERVLNVVCSNSVLPHYSLLSKSCYHFN